ncbi:uncharacterized protein, partial [Argopecten irradians]|uniref:uncharacterized protein n=1 Tax=Argopecten irradians TaxID=31199 RepID=UPI0037144A9B
LLFSSFQPATSSSSKDFYRTNDGNCGASKLANTTILCNSNEHAYFKTTVAKTKQTVTPVATSSRNDSPNLEETRSSGLSFIRKSIEGQNLSQQTTDIIVSSWRPKTSKQYQCYLKQWEGFCSQRTLDPFRSNVRTVLMFLTQLFEKGVGYSAINTAKSALSTVINLEDSVIGTLGQHALVKRFMRGVYNQRPSLPRYTHTWDVKTVLDYLESINIGNISLKDLTLKLTMLLALVSGQRVQTLHTLSVNNVKCVEDNVEIKVTALLKQSKPGKHLSVLTFEKFSNENLCVVIHLLKYIKMTTDIREDDRLLISFHKPHKSVSASTISRWIKTVMSSSGIDTEIFKSHSTRSASTSASVAQGVPVSQIMEKVGWRSAKTFQKFYNRSDNIL